MIVPVLLAIGLGAFALTKLQKGGAGGVTPSPSAPGTCPFVDGQQYHVIVRLGVGTIGPAAEGGSVIDMGVIAGPYGFGSVEQSEQDTTDKFVFRFVATWTGGTGKCIPDSPEFRIIAVTPLSAAAGQVTHIQGKTVLLKKGERYYGRGQVGFPLSLLVTENAVGSKLTGTGFTDVKSMSSADQLPPEWPQEEREGNVFAEGVWNGTDGQAFTIPDQVTSVFTIAT